MPAKAGIQYSVTVDLEYRWRRGVLDHPLSRMMTAKLPSLPQRLQNLHQLGVHELVAADHMPRLQRVVVTLDAGDDAAGFAHDDLTRRPVPGLQVALPVAIEASGRDKSHIQRGGA